MLIHDDLSSIAPGTKKLLAALGYEPTGSSPLSPRMRCKNIGRSWSRFAVSSVSGLSGGRPPPAPTHKKKVPFLIFFSRRGVVAWPCFC